MRNWQVHHPNHSYKDFVAQGETQDEALDNYAQAYNHPNWSAAMNANSEFFSKVRIRLTQEPINWNESTISEEERRAAKDYFDDPPNVLIAKDVNVSSAEAAAIRTQHSQRRWAETLEEWKAIRDRNSASTLSLIPEKEIMQDHSLIANMLSVINYHLGLSMEEAEIESKRRHALTVVWNNLRTAEVMLRGL